MQTFVLVVHIILAVLMIVLILVLPWVLYLQCFEWKNPQNRKGSGTGFGASGCHFDCAVLYWCGRHLRYLLLLGSFSMASLSSFCCLLPCAAVSHG